MTFTYAAFISILFSIFVIGFVIGFWYIINYEPKK